MLKHIFNKDDSLFFEKKLALSWRAPQENDAKFRFPIHVQGIRQFHDNCKIAKCQIVATLAPVYSHSISLSVTLVNFFVHVLQIQKFLAPPLVFILILTQNVISLFNSYIIMLF